MGLPSFIPFIVDSADCGEKKAFSGSGFARSQNTHLLCITEKEDYQDFFAPCPVPYQWIQPAMEKWRRKRNADKAV